MVVSASTEKTYYSLTYFQPMFHFYNPWIHQWTSGFLCFQGAWKRNIAWKWFNFSKSSRYRCSRDHSRKISRKTNIYLLTRRRTCAYQVGGRRCKKCWFLGNICVRTIWMNPYRMMEYLFWNISQNSQRSPRKHLQWSLFRKIEGLGIFSKWPGSENI